MRNLNREMFTESEGTLVSEASTLGIKPGCWPKTLVLEGTVYTVVEVQTEDRDLIAMKYTSPNGEDMLIYND